MLRSSLLFPSTHPPHALPQANFIHAMRLFRGVPVWTPFNRPQEEHASRKFYVDNYVSGRGGAGGLATANCVVGCGGAGRLGHRQPFATAC